MSEKCVVQGAPVRQSRSNFSSTPVAPLDNSQWPHGQPSEVERNDQASFSLFGEALPKTKGTFVTNPTRVSRNEAIKRPETRKSENAI